MTTTRICPRCGDQIGDWWQEELCLQCQDEERDLAQAEQAREDWERESLPAYVRQGYDRP